MPVNTPGGELIVIPYQIMVTSNITLSLSDTKVRLPTSWENRTVSMKVRQMMIRVSSKDVCVCFT